MRRIDFVARSSCFLAAVALRYHRICVEGAEHLPVQGPALLLPKHRAYRDILLEGVVLYSATGRLANYVMKVGLYGVFEWCGGVKIVRPKDVRRLADRQARKSRIRLARQQNLQTMEYLHWLYGRGELVVSHPEGMRHQDEMGSMKQEVVEHLLEAEKRLGCQIPMVPMGLEYESYSRPGARIFCRIGEPLYATDFSGITELVGQVAERLRSLSGFVDSRSTDSS